MSSGIKKKTKRILVTGNNSYIGGNVIRWLSKDHDKYDIKEISVRSEASWEQHDFSKYDVVIHVAGIAHVSADPKLEEIYYKINRDLAIHVAKKAKTEMVKQFIFMSSIIVYGDSSTDMRVINIDTVPNPSNFYGDSKLQAEEGILSLESNDFKIVIIRPPMIYGKGCKGNYERLSKLAQKTPVFPDIDNKRSMLYIDNLSEFIRLMIENEENGLFFPQNSEYVVTSEMVKLIAEAHGSKIRLIKAFNPLIYLINRRNRIVNKVFGSLVYEKSMSEYKDNYRIEDLRASIGMTEGKGEVGDEV